MCVSALFQTCLMLLVNYGVCVAHAAPPPLRFEFEKPSELEQNFRISTYNRADLKSRFVKQTEFGAENDYIFNKRFSSSSVVSLIFDQTPMDDLMERQSRIIGNFTSKNPLRIEFDASTSAMPCSFGVWIIDPAQPGLVQTDKVSAKALMALCSRAANGPNVDCMNFSVGGSPAFGGQIGTTVGTVTKSKSGFQNSPEHAPKWFKFVVEYSSDDGIPSLRMHIGKMDVRSNFTKEHALTTPNEVLVGLRIFDGSGDAGTAKIDNVVISVGPTDVVPKPAEVAAQPVAKPVAKPVAAVTAKPEPKAPPAVVDTGAGLALGRSMGFDFGPQPTHSTLKPYNTIDKAQGLWGLFVDFENAHVPGVGLKVAGAVTAANDIKNPDVEHYPPKFGITREIVSDYFFVSRAPQRMTLTLTGMNNAHAYDITFVGAHDVNEVLPKFTVGNQTIGLRATSKSGASLGTINGARTDGRGNLVIAVESAAVPPQMAIVNAMIVTAVKP